jgi:hypothetical protein
MRVAIESVLTERSAAAREISAVAALCSSTAAAIAVEISLIVSMT